MKIRVKKLHEDAIVPKYQTRGASGFDLHALEDVTFQAGDKRLIKTGLAISVGEGYELQIRPRSGLSLKTGLRICNSPGTVDSDYSGEVCVIMQLVQDSSGYLHYSIKKGDRIAQGVVCPVVRADIEEVDYLDETDRGSGGFGSTGSK
jgi:dUTP pyrophosphatase